MKTLFANMKNILLFVLVMVMAAGLCSCGAAGGTVSGTGSGDTVSVSHDIDSVQVVDDPSEGLILPEVSCIGDVAFDTEGSGAVSGIMPLSEGLELTATDASGAEWTLTIPAYAVPTGTEIIMTPLFNIKGEGSLASVKSGILLEPDGLLFDVVGTLSVKLPEGTPESLLLSGDQEGKGLSFVDGKTGEGTLVSNIVHFSSYFPGDAEDLKPAQDAVVSEFNTFKKVLSEFLKTSVKVPTIPAVLLENFNDSRYETVNTYVKMFNMPEAVYIEEALVFAKGFSLLGSTAGEQEAMELAKTVIDRLILKVEKILKESNLDPQKFLAVAGAGLDVYRQAALLGVETGDLFAKLLPYASKTADFCLDEFKTNHNYKYLRAMFEMARTSALFGDTKERSEEILKALKFKVSYKSVVTDVSAVDNFITTITGECTLVPSLVKDTVAFYGDGEFQYSFDWSNILGDTFNCSADPAAYHINLTEFDTEKEIISLDYDKLWSEYDHADIISAITGTSGATIDYEVISAYQSIGELLNGYTNGKFPFKLPLQNKNKTAGETTLSYEGNAFGKVNITITVTLTHTPE